MKNMTMKMMILGVAVLIGCVSCNTVKGVGRDVQSVGSDINSAATSAANAL